MARPTFGQSPLVTLQTLDRLVCKIQITIHMLHAITKQLEICIDINIKIS